jgi:hypothetical protein
MGQGTWKEQQGIFVLFELGYVRIVEIVLVLIQDFVIFILVEHERKRIVQEGNEEVEPRTFRIEGQRLGKGQSRQGQPRKGKQGILLLQYVPIILVIVQYEQVQPAIVIDVILLISTIQSKPIDQRADPEEGIVQQTRNRHSIQLQFHDDQEARKIMGTSSPKEGNEIE